MFEPPIALDPGRGGQSIGLAALSVADVIVSTTSEWLSRGIRAGIYSVVSHASAYVGDGMLVEAIGEGVVHRSIIDAASGNILMVAYRHPRVAVPAAQRVREFLLRAVGSPYSVRGAVLSTDRILCRVVGSRPGSFFCSQLVAAAYSQAGLPLLERLAECTTPDDIAAVGRTRLNYVGHIKGTPSWFPVIR